MEKQNSTYATDEIDLLELLGILWRHRIFLVLITAISLFTSYIVIRMAPPVYTSQAVIRIGQIAGYPMELPPQLKLRATQDAKEGEITISTPREYTYTMHPERAGADSLEVATIIEITSEAATPDKAYTQLQGFGTTLLTEHNTTYREATRTLATRESSDPRHYMKTWNYPSAYLQEPEKPTGEKDRRYPVKLTLVFLATLFLGSMIVLMKNSWEGRKRL